MAQREVSGVVTDNGAYLSLIFRFSYIVEIIRE
jgi:hypothetical protein